MNLKPQLLTGQRNFCFLNDFLKFLGVILCSSRSGLQAFQRFCLLRAFTVLLSRLAFWMDISWKSILKRPKKPPGIWPNYHISSTSEIQVVRDRSHLILPKSYRNWGPKRSCEVIKFTTKNTHKKPPAVETPRHQRKFMWIPQGLQGNGVHLSYNLTSFYTKTIRGHHLSKTK